MVKCLLKKIRRSVIVACNWFVRTMEKREERYRATQKPAP